MCKRSVRIYASALTRKVEDAGLISTVGKRTTYMDIKGLFVENMSIKVAKGNV